MIITVVRKHHREQWDQELARYNGSLFLSRVWVESVAQSHKNRQAVFLYFYFKNQLVAMLAGLDIAMRKGNGRQLLFYSGMAMLAEQRELYESSCKTALHFYALQCGYARITLKSYDHHYYSEKPHGKERKKFQLYPRTEYYFDLHRGKENILGRFKPDLRRRARKAGRKGLTFRTTQQPAMVNELINLINETYKRRNAKGYGPYEHFFLPLFHKQEMDRMLQAGAARFFVAEEDGRPLSIQFVFAYEGKAYGIFMGTHPKGYKHNAPAFLYYKGVEYLCDEGFSYYNLGGIQTNHRGLKMFKNSLGASRMESCEETSRFLQYPYKLWNPILKTMEGVKKARFIPGRFKKPLLRFCGFLLNGQHKY